jgi:hypothetical protein
VSGDGAVALMISAAAHRKFNSAAVTATADPVAKTECLFTLISS